MKVRLSGYVEEYECSLSVELELPRFSLDEIVEDIFESFDTDYEISIVDGGGLDSDILEYLNPYNIYDLNETVDELYNLSDDDMKKLLSVLEATNGDISDILCNLDNYTYYKGYTMREVAEMIVEEMYGGSENEQVQYLMNYIDYDDFASDLRHGNYYETDYGVVRT